MSTQSDDKPGFEAPDSTPRPWGRPLTVGVLGGMGPYATVQFMQNVLDRTPAQKDWEHVRMLVDNNNHIPSRTRALLYDETSPLAGMVDSCKRLQAYPVDVIALPCNSACHWLNPLRTAVKTPILDIVGIAAQEMLRQPNVHRVAALSGHVPHQTNLYGPFIEEQGGQSVRLNESDQADVVGYIEAIKAAGHVTDEHKTQFASLVTRLANEYSLDGVILACTEFSLVADAPFSIPVVDSSHALAQAVVDYAYHGKPLMLNVAHVKAFWEQRATLLQDGEAGLLQATMLTSTEEEAEERLLLEQASLMGAIEPILQHSESILELGCGTGRWSRILAPHVAQIDAYDFSQALIEIARNETKEAGYNHVRFHCESIENVPQTHRVDTCISIALLHYLDENQFKAAMNLVRTSVLQGGHAVFRETFGVDRRFELHGFHSNVLNTTYHAVYRTPGEIAQALGDDFQLILDEETLAPTPEKPETSQRMLVFHRSTGRASQSD